MRTSAGWPDAPGSLDERMKPPRLGLTLLLIAVAGGTGFALRGFVAGSGGASPLAVVPRAEYFASAESFSEVDQMRTRLRALALRYLYWVQVRDVESVQGVRTAGRAGGVAMAEVHAQARRELEEGLAEFRGTGEEPVLTHGLLLLLASEGDHARWVEVYLDLLYRRPTEHLVGQLAPTALIAGRACGRLDAVLEGFRQVTHIPLEFEAKHRVQSALAGGVIAQAGAGSVASGAMPSGG